MRWSYLSIPKLQPGGALEVWEWLSNFIPHFMMGVISYLCWGWSYSMLVKGAQITADYGPWSQWWLRHWPNKCVHIFPVSVWMRKMELKQARNELSGGRCPRIRYSLSLSHLGRELWCTTVQPASHTLRANSSAWSRALRGIPRRSIPWGSKSPRTASGWSTPPWNTRGMQWGEGAKRQGATAHFNRLRAKFFRGNTNMYLHFMSFLHIDLTQVLKILPRVREGPTYSIKSIS